MAAHSIWNGEPQFHPGSNQEHFDYTSHLAPVSLYVGIWAALMVGTGLTVFAASVELGIFNIVVAGTADRVHQGHAGCAVFHAPALQHNQRALDGRNRASTI